MPPIVDTEKGQRGDKVNQHWGALAVLHPLGICHTKVQDEPHHIQQLQ